MSCDVGGQATQKSVNDSRKIVTKAWIGTDGQNQYEMTIHFGKRSLRHYAKRAELIECLPSEKTMDWVDIDTVNQAIELRLK